MAIPALAPAIARSRKVVAERSSEVFLKLVPPVEDQSHDTNKFFAIFVTSLAGVGFIFLLVINTLLAQDAFELSSLKSEVKLVADQREAINRAIDLKSAPAALARQAYALNMRPSETPVFINLTQEKTQNG